VRVASCSRVGPLVSGGRPRSSSHRRVASEVSAALRVVRPAARARLPGRLEMVASLGSSFIIGKVIPVAASVAASISTRRAVTPAGVISANIDAVDANGPTASNAPTAAVVAQRKRKAPRSLKGANAGRIDFSEYDVDFQITAA
jgi:hypothetical protein